MEVWVESQQGSYAPWEETVRRALSAGLAELRPSGAVGVLLTDDAGIQALNRAYRGQDKPTDVLSFSQQEGDEMPGGQDLLGDVVVSVERAAEQAERFGHTMEREMGFLALHGLLHLLGFDHEDPADEAIMMRTAEGILSQVGLTRP